MATASEANAMGRDDRFVSPYLLRPLRSYLQAVRDRARKRRRAGSRTSQAPKSGANDGTPGGSSRRKKPDHEK